MKYFMLFLLFACAVSEKRASTSEEKVIQDMRECSIKIGIDPNVKTPTKDQENCYIACLSQKLGVLKEDGTVDFDGFVKKYANHYESPKEIENLRKNIEIKEVECRIRAGNDICKFAACLHEKQSNTS